MDSLVSNIKVDLLGETPLALSPSGGKLFSMKLVGVQ